MGRRVTRGLIAVVLCLAAAAAAATGAGPPRATTAGLFGVPDDRGISGPYGVFAKGGPGDNEISAGPGKSKRYRFREGRTRIRLSRHHEGCIRISASVIECQGYWDSAVFLNGSKGEDRIRIRPGTPYYSSVVLGGRGRDRLTGGRDGSRVGGGTGDDLLRSRSADSVLHGDAGDDVLIGSAGDETFDGGPGADAIAAGAGDDEITIADGHPDRRLDCGPGRDRAFVDRVDPRPKHCEHYFAIVGGGSG
jgi:Ca2+-binding RTX toxin-like protein